MPEVKSLTVHLDEDTLRRLEALAERKNTDHVTLATQFITERLGKEEERNRPPASLARMTPKVHRKQSTGTTEIYTDGGCRNNPGPGGWAAMIYEGPKPREISGAQRSTTNQQMKLRAAIEGLRSLKRPSRVRIYSDSAYVINAFKEGWLDRWESSGWRKANKKPVMNAHLWKELLQVASPHEVEWIKVEGHTGNAATERCHHLVQLAIDSLL